jgi:hypothetical protein
MFSLLKEVNSCLVTIVQTVSCVLNVIQSEVTKDLTSEQLALPKD